MSESGLEFVIEKIGDMSCADFFLVNGICMKDMKSDGKKLNISGHSMIFTFNLETNSFENHSVS